MTQTFFLFSRALKNAQAKIKQQQAQADVRVNKININHFIMQKFFVFRRLILLNKLLASSKAFSKLSAYSHHYTFVLLKRHLLEQFIVNLQKPSNSLQHPMRSIIEKNLKMSL